MLHCIIAVFFAAACLLATAGERWSLPDPRYAVATDRLVDEMKRGGYTLYFRHTATDFSQNDTRLDLADCATQRNLTDAGREQARRIGRVLAALALPVGEVLASPYCRTMETARLISGREPRGENAVRGKPGPAGTPEYSDLERLLTTPPAPGTIRLIAGHGTPIRSISGPPHLEEGEAMLVVPLGDRWAIASRLRIGDWDALLERKK